MEALAPRPFHVYTRRHLGRVPQLARLGADEREAMLAVSAVLPFRVNDYVLDELIDWDNLPDDPMYQLTFPQPGMLPPQDFERMLELVRSEASEADIAAAARTIQADLNPQPAGQLALNVPVLDGEKLAGMQHKYRETVLFFPAQGQTCHAYCTYCFRWAQFVGLKDLKFQSRDAALLHRYVAAHPEVRDLLFTGGDPMVMSAEHLERYIEPLLTVEHLNSVRIGTKALAYWPYRFVTDPDAGDVLRIFERVVASGKHLAVMAHFSHPRELQTRAVREAIRRVRETGAEIRAQAPLIRHVNDAASVWATMWREQVRLGIVPYYMFVERDTGAKGYFEVPLVKAAEIFADAYRQVSGLARTVRGPSMSATPGKVLVEGTTRVAGQRVLLLKMVQARDPKLVGKLYFARYDARATWLDHLEPAFDATAEEFERELLGAPGASPGWVVGRRGDVDGAASFNTN